MFKCPKCGGETPHARRLCPECKDTDRAAYVPTPAQIAASAKEIRAEWSKKEEQKRRINPYTRKTLYTPTNFNGRSDTERED